MPSSPTTPDRSWAQPVPLRGLALARTYPEDIGGFGFECVTEKKEIGWRYGGGDTDLSQLWHNPIPREHYHTDWVADRAIAWLDSLPEEEDWFLWMSFPDPHHPWDPPASELHRCPWRDLDLPDFYPGSPEKIVEILKGKPRHWLDWYEGKGQFNYEVPPLYRPNRDDPGPGPRGQRDDPYRPDQARQACGGVPHDRVVARSLSRERRFDAAGSATGESRFVFVRGEAASPAGEDAH